MKYTFLGFFLFCQVACGLPEPEPPCGFLISHGFRISWNAMTPVILYADINLSNNQAYVTTFEMAANVWNEAAGKSLIRISSSRKDIQSQYTKNEFNTISLLYDWAPFLPQQSAITRTYSAMEQILETDIVVNMQYRTWYTGNGIPSRNEMDLLSVAIHELGHSLGLTHSADSNSVMYPYIQYGEIRRQLTQQDISNLHCEY